MIKSINCTTCKNKHFDHWECGDCGYDLGFVNPNINYCPNCGSKLVKGKINLLSRQCKHRANQMKIKAINIRGLKKGRQ